MIILDFTNSSFDYRLIKWNLEESWQKDIFQFLEDWYSNSESIITQTSGSTGNPKSIEIPKLAMIQSANATGEFLHFQPNITALLCLPSGFIAGKMMLVRAIIWKMKLYCITPSVLFSWNLKVDFVAMTPMQVIHHLPQISNFHIIIIGGASISKELNDALQKYNSIIFETYGMTETISHIAMRPINKDAFQLLPNVHIRINEQGCLCIQTPYNSEEIITNDLVELLPDNHFKWLGRNDFVINSGGVKLIPEVIENKLQPFWNKPILVGGIPDAVLGQKLVLLVESNIPIENPIQDYQQDPSIKSLEIPKAVYFLPQFIRTETNKINRIETLKLIP